MMSKKQKVTSKMTTANGTDVVCGDSVRILTANSARDVRVHNVYGTFVGVSVGEHESHAIATVAGLPVYCKTEHVLQPGPTRESSTPQTWFHAGKPVDTALFERTFGGAR